MLNLKREPTETETQYGWRLYTYLKSGELTWQELADLMNRDCRADESEYRTESAYRKPLQGAQKYWDEVFSKRTTDNDILQEIEDKRRELEREKIQLRDERTAWNKQNYIAARVEQKLDCLERNLKDIGEKIYNPNPPDPYKSGNDLLIVLSDIHIGLQYKSAFGEYDSDIADQRLRDYLNEIIKIRMRHDSQRAFVVLAGDMISGSIHKTVQISNRENVIKQVKMVSECVAAFCFALSEWFGEVNIISVTGNHTRIDKKEDALKDERLDDLVTYIVGLILNHVNNVHILNDAMIDNTIAKFKIRGNDYVLVHGDYDSPTDSSVMRLCSMIQCLPKCIISGHRHTPALTEINGIKILQSGSLCGSGDDYTIQKRLSGAACQTVAVCTNKGIDCIYPIEFN